MGVLSAITATLVAFYSFSPAAAIPAVTDVEARNADPWGPICFYNPREPKKPCTYWKSKREQDTPVITKLGPGHVYVPPLRFGGLGHVPVAPLPVTRVEVIPIDEPTPAPAPTGKLEVIPIEKRAPEPTFVTTFTIPVVTIPLTPGVTVTPFKTTIVIRPPSSAATSTRLSFMTPIKVTQTPKPTTPIPTFTITSIPKPTTPIPTFTITSIPLPPAEPSLEIPTNIDLTSTFQPPPPKLEIPTAIDLTSTFKPSPPPPSPTFTSSLNLGPLGLTFSSTLNLGPLVPPTTTPTPPPTPIVIPTEGLTFSSQLTFPLLPLVTARALRPSHAKEVIIELKPDV
ncbi:hypothetical protein QBC41DRAFT_240933 [Cercophora samala]|uniref:Uncharacterized protein n=1 Tax=Cercophora samala TaxID=330535 RepID=A0AA39ZMI1_9PEZI|nr:hypothetical protein QBC41DRAFT_240933 [Cercophora samala]